MSGFNRTFRLLSSSLRHQIIPRARLTEKPAKEVITPVEQGIALVAMFATILVPSGWILANLENYKRR
ncbi:cytochrome c oxidase subunit 8B [Amia ocellicauda]|uniref:cytochrome c oxidase subunit 8B n=1 Tax=Amia ocellicauda TaxID=2972642 RepID=UPI0034645687|nr:COX8B oxidase [Amia calva]